MSTESKKSESKKEGRTFIAKEVKQIPTTTAAEPKTPQPTKKTTSDPK